MKTGVVGPAAWLLCSALLLAFLYPVRTLLGPEWVGHFRTGFIVPGFVPAWRIDGPETVWGILAAEPAVALLPALCAAALCRGARAPKKL